MSTAGGRSLTREVTLEASRPTGTAEISRLVRTYAFQPAPYPTSRDFLALLREEAGPQHEQLITDLFEKISLYDMQASEATATRRPDGRYEVRFTVQGRKRRRFKRSTDRCVAMT